jgi:hypothetical protein
MSNNFINKRYGKAGEVGETVTWMVATVIIIVVLFISISATVTGVFNFKNFNYIKQADTLASKSLFAYLLTESEKGISVYSQLGSENNFSSFNGQLAKDIFSEFYDEEYLAVWVGFFRHRIVLPYESNEYFGKRPGEGRKIGGLVAIVPHIKEEVKLNKDASVELTLKTKEWEASAKSVLNVGEEE